MIIQTSVTAAILIDQRAKETAEAVRAKSAEIVRNRALQCASPLHKSPFADCPDCGMDLLSEVLRDAKTHSHEGERP